jgi:hypothetical protein
MLRTIAAIAILLFAATTADAQSRSRYGATRPGRYCYGAQWCSPSAIKEFRTGSCVAWRECKRRGPNTRW